MEIEILLNSIDKVKDFSEIIHYYKGKSIITDGKHRIAADSILGIFSLDLTKKLLLILEGPEEENIKILPKLDKYREKAMIFF